MSSRSNSVLISVSGLVISLSRRQLNKYPNTRLAQQFLHSKSTTSNSTSLYNGGHCATSQKVQMDENHEEVTMPISDKQTVVVYYFNRNPLLFVHIIDFYRTGMLHFPHQYCWTSVADELAYWRIDTSFLAECCQKSKPICCCQE